MPKDHQQIQQFVPQSLIDAMQALPQKERESINQALAIRSEIVKNAEIKRAQQNEDIKARKLLLQQQADLYKSELSKDASENQDVLMYGAAQHDLARQQAMIDADVKMKSAQLDLLGQDKQYALSYLKQVKDDIEKQYGDSLKPFDQTEAFKIQKERINSQQFQRTPTVLAALRQDLVTAESKPETQQAEYLKRNAVKIVNNLISQDAVQTGEFITKFKDLADLPEFALLTNKSLFNPTVWAAKYATELRDQLADPSSSLSKKISNALESTIGTNPKRVIDDFKDIHDSSARAWNESQFQQVERATSPKLIRSLGVSPIPQIKQADQSDKQEAPIGATFVEGPKSIGQTRFRILNQ